MEKLLPYFPISAKVDKSNVVSLVVAIVIYVVVAAVLGAILGFVGKIPVVGLVTKIIGTLIWIYEIVGIVLAIYVFVK